MGFTHPPGHLSGSQSSLASEMGTGSADPQGGTLPQADPKGPGEYPAAVFSPLLPPRPRPLSLTPSKLETGW